MSKGNVLRAVEAAEVELGGRKPVVDWSAVERDFRSGLHSLRELGRKHHTSPPAVLRRVDEYGWQKDLAAPIRHAAAQMALKDTADARQRRRDVAARLQQQGVLQADAEEVASAADQQASVLRAHRSSAEQARTLVKEMTDKLLAEFATLQSAQAFLREALTSDDSRKSRADALLARQVLATVPSFLDCVKALDRLVSSLAKTQAMERTAWALDVVKEESGTASPVRKMSDIEREHRTKWLLNKMGYVVATHADLPVPNQATDCYRGSRNTGS